LIIRVPQELDRAEVADAVGGEEVGANAAGGFLGDDADSVRGQPPAVAVAAVGDEEGDVVVGALF